MSMLPWVESDSGSMGLELKLGRFRLVVTKEYIINLLVFITIYGFLLSIFKPSLMLSMTITTGGDTASHYYPAKFLRD